MCQNKVDKLEPFQQYLNGLQDHVKSTMETDTKGAVTIPRCTFRDRYVKLTTPIFSIVMFFHMDSKAHFFSNLFM